MSTDPNYIYFEFHLIRYLITTSILDLKNSIWPENKVLFLNIFQPTHFFNIESNQLKMTYIQLMNVSHD